ncbi:hypothetical protein AAC387_Pa06g2243 [Persea americana]
MGAFRSQAEDLVARLERSCERVERKKVPIEKLTTSIHKKLSKFNSAFGTTFEDFTMDPCSSSQSDEEDVKKKITITFKHRKRVVVKSPGLKKSTKRTTPPVDAEPFQQFMVEGFGPHSLVVLPIEQVLGTPSVTRTLSTSPVPVSSESAMVVSAQPATLDSLLWRIKRLPHMRKIPIKFKDYDHSIAQRSYELSDLDKYFLKGFKEYYEEK